MNKNILFVCTHNSARSQMAEGLMNSLFGDRYQAYSCGSEPGSVNPFAIEVMSELKINMENSRSKGFDEFIDLKPDLVVTVCDNAKEQCPIFSGCEEYIHYSFNDPSSVRGDDTDKLAAFRHSRDEIKEWLLKTFMCS